MSHCVNSLLTLFIASAIACLARCSVPAQTVQMSPDTLPACTRSSILHGSSKQSDAAFSESRLSTYRTGKESCSSMRRQEATASSSAGSGPSPRLNRSPASSRMRNSSGSGATNIKKNILRHCSSSSKFATILLCSVNAVATPFEYRRNVH